VNDTKSDRRRRYLGGGAVLVLLAAILFAFTNSTAGAADCDISRFVGSDGTVDVASYLQCQAPSVSDTEVVPGEAITFSGGGYAANSNIDIELRSTPVQLGSTTADDVGNFSVEVVIPLDTPPGQHELAAIGIDPDGNPLTTVLPITVVATGGASGGSGGSGGTLPTTGSDIGRSVGLGLGLILVGGAVVWSVRKERTSGAPQQRDTAGV